MKPPLACRRGFTLIEIVLAMVIFALLAGGIFTAVSTATRSTAVVTLDLTELRTADAFLDFCRMGFLHAGAAERISVTTRSAGGSGRILELTLRDAPDAFRTGLADAPGSCVVLAARPDGSGAATMSLTRYPADSGEEAVKRHLENPGVWMPLLAGVTKLRWTYFNRDTGKFEEDWTIAPKDIPAVMMEFSTPATGMTSAIFRIPKVVREEPGAAPEVNPSPSPTPKPPGTP